MNHWFLVGRDVMWMIVLITPPCCFFVSGNVEAKKPELASVIVWLGITTYGALLSSLYFGVIK